MIKYLWKQRKKVTIFTLCCTIIMITCVIWADVTDDMDPFFSVTCAVDAAIACWPRDQLMPSCSWCNWWKCAENQVTVVIYTLPYCVSSACEPRSHVNAELLFDASQPSPSPSYLVVWLYLCFEENKLSACLLAALHMEGKKSALGSLLYMLAVWPHVQRRQHSSCYRYASVRVIMVAAQPEISFRYLWSAENVLFATTKHTLTHPIARDQVTHEDCYFTFLAFSPNKKM